MVKRRSRRGEAFCRQNVSDVIAHRAFATRN
jgi:hypothetical protein